MRSLSVDLEIDGPTRERRSQIAVASHDQKRLAADVCHQLPVTSAFGWSNRDFSFGYAHLAQEEGNPAPQPRSVFEQRRCELRRRNHFLDVLVGDRCATLTARRITDCDDCQRMWVWQSKQRVTRLATTDLHFTLDQTGVFESLNRNLLRLCISGEQLGRIAFLVRVVRVAQKDARAFVFEFRGGENALAHRLLAQAREE